MSGEISDQQLQRIAALFELGALREAQSVAGGLSHRLFRVESSNRSFALKVLSPRAVDSEAKIAALERSETVAELAAQAGVPALVARRGQNGNFLQNALGERVLLWDWQEGQARPCRRAPLRRQDAN